MNNIKSIKKYFLTSEILNLDRLSNIKDIFYLKTLPKKKCFIENLDLDLQNKKIEKFNSDNEVFQNLLQNWNKDPIDIKLFVEQLINNKYKLQDNIKYSEHEIKISKNLFYNSNNLNNFIKDYDPKYTYKNPINYSFLLEILKDSIFHKALKENNTEYYQNIEKIKKNLDILIEGSYINYLLPSVGIIYPKISLNNKDYTEPKSYFNLIKIILDLDKKLPENIISSNIPLLSLDISEKISSILDYNNSNLYITKKIDEIRIDLDEIFFIKNKNNKGYSKNKILKPEYVIPYKFDENKKEIIEIERIEKISTVEQLFSKNYKVVISVLEDVYNTEHNAFDKLNKKNYKNVLACFLFFIIQVIYDINKQYINKINNIVIEFSEHYKDEYRNLDIKNTLEYISLLSKSLYKFKLILLNNFYYFFIPSKTYGNNYGMKKNEFNFLIPESDFLVSNIDLYKNFPFTCLNNSLKISDTDEKNPTKILKFILNTVKKMDLYDKDEYLDFGGYSFDKKILTDSISLLTQFLGNNFVLSTNFFLEIIKKIEYNFLEKKEFQIELINRIIDDLSPIVKKKNFTKDEKKYFKNKINSMFTINYENSISNLIDLINLNKKNNLNYNEDTLNKRNIKKDILKLQSRLFMFKAMSVYHIVENNTVDISFKNEMIIEFEEKKKKFDNKIKKIYKS